MGGAGLSQRDNPDRIGTPPEAPTPRQLVRRAWRGMIRAVEDIRELVDDQGEVVVGKLPPQRVHRLRVASRRLQAAFALVENQAHHSLPKRLRRKVRALRRAAGPIRNADVHAGLVESIARSDTRGVLTSHLRPLRDAIAADRALAQSALIEVVLRTHAGELRRQARRWRKLLPDDPAPAGAGVGPHASHEALAPLIEAVLNRAAAPLQDVRNLHELRLRLKPLRYAVEQLERAGGVVMPAGVGALLGDAQQRLGEINDIATLALRCASVPGAELLARRLDRVADVRSAAFASWWTQHDVPGSLQQVRCLWPDTAASPAGLVPTAGDASIAHAAPSPTPPPCSLRPRRMEAPMLDPLPAQPMPHGEDAPLADRATRHVATEPAQGALFLAGRRLGVIDIGSNSIRLLVAELIDERHWKVLVEERAMTRLAHGLDEQGELTSEAMAHSVEAISRFKATCDRLGATCQAFATAAVRDAKNQRDFLSLVKDRAGLSIETISGAAEGKYTYRSVARAHDLSHGLCAVVDIGGGSLEVVTSLDGVIIANTTMPLGAVRLTDRFGGPELVAGKNFPDLKRWCERIIDRNVRAPEAPPQVIVGCGGTFNTLLTLAAATRGVMIDRGSPALRELGPVTREQLKDLIAHLRSMTLAERLRVPGLPSDRADIIIAGLTAIERLMKHLGASRIHGYPGGTREGLLMRAIDELRGGEVRGPAPLPASADMLGEVRAFAQRCRYEREHSEQVARLAVRIFDQFRAESDMILKLGEEPRERTLLEAACVLHDVGMLVEYRRHHKHGATIVRYADFATLSARQQELLALLTRYHRKAEPGENHEEFAALPQRDQQLVRRLAGILRVADGLDRTHAQVVHDVRVRFGKEGVRIVALCVGDASEEVRAATAKAGLLEDVLGVGLTIEAAPVDAGHTADTDAPPAPTR